MKKTGFLLFLLSLCFALQLKAEINIGWSVEALTVKADVIVSGTLLEIDSVKGKKNDDMLACSLKIIKLFKGKQENDTLYFCARQYYNTKTFYAMKGKEVMVFLSETIQAMSYKEHNYNKWAIDNIGGGDPLVIRLDSINRQVFCASNFTKIKTRHALEHTINYTLQQTEKYLRKHKKEDIKIQFLDLPFESEAFSVLYSGSACFLYVPHFMFTKSKKSLVE